MPHTDKRKHEVIWIKCPDGQEIAIHVKEVSAGVVKLGIEAPREYGIKHSRGKMI